MRTNIGVSICSAILIGVLPACSSPSRTPVYQAGQVGQIISSQQGEVIAVQDVLIQGASQHAGSPGPGAQIGSAIGSGILGNPVAAATAAAGRIVGGMAGSTADNKRGEEITILLRDGRTVVIVQERGDVPFVAGDRVKIMSGSGGSIYSGASNRVVRDDGSMSEPVGMRQ